MCMACIPWSPTSALIASHLQVYLSLCLFICFFVSSSVLSQWSLQTKCWNGTPTVTNEGPSRGAKNRMPVCIYSARKRFNISSEIGIGSEHQFDVQLRVSMVSLEKNISMSSKSIRSSSWWDKFNLPFVRSWQVGYSRIRTCIMNTFIFYMCNFTPLVVVSCVVSTVPDWYVAVTGLQLTPRRTFFKFLNG